METTIKQLRYFATVVETGSFRKAAERLGVSQPTLTTQIAALEKTMGASVLERTPQGTAASPLGRTLLPHVHSLLHQVREITNITQDAARSPFGTHRLGVPSTLGPYLLPDIIPEIHRTYPSLRIFVREATPQKLEEGLHDGSFDLIFTPLPLDIADFTCEPLFSEPLQVICPPDHKLVGQKTIMPDQFIGENFLVIEEKHGFFIHVQKLAEQFGFRLLRDFEGTSLDTLRQMIGTGLGLSFLPALYIRSEIAPRNDVTILDLGFELPRREIALAWRPRSPQKHLYQQLTRIIRDICRNQLSGHVQVLGSTLQT